jgi:type IV pilus assembly protein PilE
MINSRAIKGFSLLELIIVVVVAGVIAAIAIPSYQEQSQEQFFLDNKSYTTTIIAGGLNMNAITESGSYALSVDAPTGACPLDRCYRVRATPQGAQSADSCGPLTINSERVKSPNGCW